LKTRRNREPRINLVGLSPVEVERIRASLSRSPFCFIDSPIPAPEEDVDLYIAPAQTAISLLSKDSATCVPVIASGKAAHMRAALLAGAADYLRDPWTPEELELRAFAAIEKRAALFDFPWGSVSLEGTGLRVNDGELALTYNESKILRSLLLNRGSPVPRSALAYRLWGRPGPAGSRAVDMHVAAIRKKIATAVPAAGRLIWAVRNEGYLIP
jgi:DNA-binding response OmpR family regulator